ncbi:MAG: serine/threonine protein kinase, partial [Planctomycetaceae bacterium]|nr:serine/threonine protein kinase [Planctomycetaceae bacterium]
MSEPSKHPSTEELSAFSLGRLTPDVAQSVEDHVSECLPCCETIVRLSSEDTFVDLLQEVGPDPSDQRTSVGEAVAGDAEALPQPLLDHPRYEVQSLIGRGGMGRVYRARHRMMDRAVALKVINREWVRQPEVIDRFRREVKTAASLDHRNIVTAHDAEHAGDTHFLVMEFVEGVDLAETVRQRGPLPVSEACEYIRQAAVGLEYAHTRGMVHRDIKPHNLIVTQDNVVKILDFGLASLTPQGTPEAPIRADADGNLTIAGAIMGTPDFISPEQAQDAHQVDGRSDIYSLGMTLYYLLAGRVPFAEGSATDKLKQHAEAEPPPLGEIRGDVPAALQHVIAQMTEKQRADRLQSPEEVGAALAAFIDKTSVPTNVTDPQSAPVPSAEVRAGRRGWKVLSSLALGGLFALACVMYQQWNSPERDRDRLDAFLATGQSSEPAGDILRRLLRSDAGRSYLRKLDAKYPKLAYTDGDFSPGYTQVAALAYVNRETGVPEPDLLVIGSSATTSGMHQRGLPEELIIKSVEFDSADDDTCQAIFTLITLDETEFMELRTGSVYESRIGIKDLLGQNGRNSKSLFDAFVAASYQRKATAAEATASQWEFQRELKAPPVGERPAASPLMNRTLTGIRNNGARWVFTWDKVTITSDVPSQPLPADVVWEVLESDGEHQKIHASWQLMNRNQQVELFNIKVDDEASPREVRLPFAAAGNIRVNLGSHQYNCRPTSQLAAAELSPSQLTELQAGSGKRVDQIAEAVCRAAGVSTDQWERFMKDAALKKQSVGDPLSLVLPQPLSTLAGQPPAQLSDLRAAMSLSVSRGYYS